MAKPFKTRNSKLKRWLIPCFFAIIVAGWSLSLVSGGYPIPDAHHTAFFAHIEESGFFTASPSFLHNVLLATPFALSRDLIGFDGAVILALSFKLALIALCPAYACHWLYRRGLPVWVGFVAAVAAAAFWPFAGSAAGVDSSATIVACLLLLALKTVDALRDDCIGLRKGATLPAILILLSILVHLHPAFCAPGIVFAVCLIMVPVRSKMRVFGHVLVAAVVNVVLLVLVLPYLGLQEAPQVFSAGLLHPDIEFVFTWALLPVAAVTVWLMFAKPLRNLLTVVLLLLLYPLAVSGVFFESPGFIIGIFENASILVLPILATVPFMYEYSETKDEIRSRLLEARKAIPREERVVRSQTACKKLSEDLKRFNKDGGFIGLYSAFGSELSLEPLKAELGALGYRLAYPVRTGEVDMEFFTTIGLSDEALLETVVRDDPFTAGTTVADPLMPRVDPHDIFVMVIPCVGMDGSNNRLGFGKGCYDRYLARLKPKTPIWMVGFREQFVDTIPTESHDRPADVRVVV